jgi:hypothetical protein
MHGQDGPASEKRNDRPSPLPSECPWEANYWPDTVWAGFRPRRAAGAKCNRVKDRFPIESAAGGSHVIQVIRGSPGRRSTLQRGSSVQG